MKSWRPTTRPRLTRVRRALAAAAVAALALTSTAALTASPAAALACSPGTIGSSSGALCGVSLTVSNNAANTSKESDDTTYITKNGARYTWAFTTGTTAALTSLKLTVPSTTSGSGLSVPQLLGITGCTGGTPGIASGIVTVTFAGTCDVTQANTPVVIQIEGFVNPTASTTGGVTTDVQTFSTAGGATPVDDSGTVTESWDFADNTTGVSVFVPESLTFTNDADQPSISLAAVPGGPTSLAPTVTLTVATNINGGYALSACIQGGLLNGSSVELPQAGTSVTGPPAYTAAVLSGTSGFGAGATTSQGSVGGALTPGSISSGYTGYATDCATGTTSIMSDDGPASDDSAVITNAASASSTQASGTYGGTITYVVAPSY